MSSPRWLVLCALIVACGAPSGQEDVAPIEGVCDGADAACPPAASEDELSRDELERQLDRIEQEITERPATTEAPDANGTGAAGAAR
jgi:hypothetical protein